MKQNESQNIIFNSSIRIYAPTMADTSSVNHNDPNLALILLSVSLFLHEFQIIVPKFYLEQQSLSNSKLKWQNYFIGNCSTL